MADCRDFGIQTYCFKAWKENREVARRVAELGLAKVEVCGVHADFSDAAAWGEAVAIYADAGIAVASIGVQTFRGADAEKAWFEAAAAAGATQIAAHLTVETFPAAIPKIRAWSREFGVRVGLHCHGGWMFGGSPDVIEYLIGLGGPEIGLCMDTAWAMQIGPYLGDPVAWVRRFGGSLYGIHYKDFIFGRDGQWEDAVLGEGNLDLPALLRALDAVPFDGVAILEYEGNFADPLPALHRCVEAIRAAG